MERPEVQQTTSRKIDNLLAVIIELSDFFLETIVVTRLNQGVGLPDMSISFSHSRHSVCVCPAILPTCGGLSVPVPPSLWRCIYTVPAMAMIMRCVTTRAGGRTGNLSHELNLAPLCHAQLLVPVSSVTQRIFYPLGFSVSFLYAIYIYSMCV